MNGHRIKEKSSDIVFDWQHNVYLVNGRVYSLEFNVLA